MTESIFPRYLWQQQAKLYGTKQKIHGKIQTKKEPIRTLRFVSRLPCHVSDNMLYIKAYKEIFIGRYLKYLIGCLGFHPDVSMREMKQPLGFQLYWTNLDANCTKLMSHVIPHGIQSGEI